MKTQRAAIDEVTAVAKMKSLGVKEWTRCSGYCGCGENIAIRGADADDKMHVVVICDVCGTDWLNEIES